MKKGILYIIDKLSEDHCSWIVRKGRNIRLQILKLSSGMITKRMAWIKGIKLGKHCEFYGRPYFSRTPHSSIVIGDQCRFRSDRTSNLIGINHRCIISTLTKQATIRIGNGCGISGSSIGAANEIVIGANVMIGANCIITDTDWHNERLDSEATPVIIRDNVFIGVNSVVLKGVEIGENTIIGANSLVVKSLPANVVAGGNPCKVLKNIAKE